MTHFDSSQFPRLDTAVQDPDSDVLTLPEIVPDLDDGDTNSGAYRVILYNDNYHDVEEVIEQVMKACECDEIHATQIVVEVDYKGRAICYKGGRGKCHKVARVLREIRLQCEVDSDD